MILPSRLQTILMKPTEKGMHRFSGGRERDSFRKLIESRQVLTRSHPVATINYCIVEGFYKIRYLGSKGKKNERKGNEYYLEMWKKISEQIDFYFKTRGIIFLH